MAHEICLLQLIHRSNWMTNHYRPLLESYVSSYFSEQCWKLLPSSWLQLSTLDELLYLLSGYVEQSLYQLKLNKLLPLSLLAYRVLCMSTQLNVIYQCGWQHNSILFANSHIFERSLFEQTRNQSVYKMNQSKHSGIISPQFNRHLTPKKRYEIGNHSDLISSVDKLVNTHQVKQSEEVRVCYGESIKHDAIVLDIGSGQGHLSRLLSLHYQFTVLNIEADVYHSNRASKYDREMANSLGRNSHNDQPLIPPKHVSFRLTNETSCQDINKLVEETFPIYKMPNFDQNIGDVIPHSPNYSIILNGLHACGDLGVTILNFFNVLLNAKAVITIGCCYMKSVTQCRPNSDGTDLNRPKSCNKWTPRSNYLRILGIQFQYTALEVACHSITPYFERLLIGVRCDPLKSSTVSTDHLRIHGYRAFIELLLTRRCKDHELQTTILNKLRIVRGSFKQATHLRFTEYSLAILSRLKLVTGDLDPMVVRPFAETEIDEALSSIGSYKSPDELWFPVVRYHVLRLMLAPVVETLISIDRLLVLREQGHNCCLIRLFDYAISPRNIAVVGMKR